MSACHAAACAALERELGERHGLRISDFEVLERLAESDGRKFRAQDLAEAVHLSQSALSRLVDRLARHGLVERCGCDVDRRGVYVVLTEAGEKRHAEAVPTHRDVLARHLPASMLSAAGSGPEAPPGWGCSAPNRACTAIPPPGARGGGGGRDMAYPPPHLPGVRAPPPPP